MAKLRHICETGTAYRCVFGVLRDEAHVYGVDFRWVRLFFMERLGAALFVIEELWPSRSACVLG